MISSAAAQEAKPTPRSEVAQTLNRSLAHTPMRHTGYQLERAGWRYHIHPALIAAIAGTESSFGSAACSNNRYNAFGLASCNESWRVPAFHSWEHAYNFMGRFLSQRWPHAQTPYDYSGYAACTSCWGRKVAYYMQKLGFRPEVRYP